MTTSGRRGLALPAAVFTISIIVLFVAGSAFAATQEARAARGSLSERLALESAEYGVATVLRDWRPAWSVSTAVGQTLGPFTYALAGGSLTTVRVTRTSLTNWWVVSEGSVGSVMARRATRTVSAAMRLDLVLPASDAALAVSDSARVTGTGSVDGTDSLETFASCGSLTSVPVVGVAAPDTTRISGLAGISGTPPLAVDATVATRFVAIDSLLAANIVLPPGAVVSPGPMISAGVCDTLVNSNWGDPSGIGPCGAHFPVIRALGDVTVRGGTGQGTLIAAGDVVFENGASFQGLVMAHDDFLTGAGGGSVLGAVAARDLRRGSGDQSDISSGGRIRRSSCRVLLARLAAAAPMRVKHRWWAEFD